jgi:hypothetical protein
MAWHNPPVAPVVPPETLDGMTWETWMYLPATIKDKLRDNSGLCPMLTGLEGWRVEVIDCYSDEEGQSAARRFIVGKSTGWRPCHLELHNRRSRGGDPAAKRYTSIRKIEKIR